MGTFVGTLLKHVGTAGAVNIEINPQSSEKFFTALTVPTRFRRVPTKVPTVSTCSSTVFGGSLHRLDCGAALMLGLERALSRLLVFRYS